MYVVVDNRETEKRKKRAKKVFDDVKIKKLDSGDYVCENVAVELKTASDFINSVKSRRIYKQAVRMAESYEKHYIIVYGSISSAMEKAHYLGHPFSTNQFIGSLSSLSQITQVLQVNNESQAFKLMHSLFEKSTDDRNRFVIKPDNTRTNNKIVGIVMYLGGMNERKASELVKKNNVSNISDLLELDKEDVESIKGIGSKTSEKLMRWLK